ncbi:PREDICTED: SET and MYND domain-containing protein 4-like [Polistes canadensis]|uniref:SET and MYND domain-containing protein 4-like n=1 Tax=Polistes canadensis TaxID=91411 RepID=UPI000718BF44|nr:PREDICTED: SET and MYND domain-containing protein 4-like [Polistes canadensis]
MLAVHSLLTRRIEDEDKVSEVMKDFNKKDNDHDRIKKVLEVMVQFDITPKVPLLTKENILSKKYQNMADSLFLKEPVDPKNLKEILILYTKSVAHGAPLSEQIGLSYVSRAALLFYMKEFKDCISDIDRAVTIDLEDKLKIQIKLQRIECLLELGESIKNDYTNMHNMVQQLPEETPNKHQYLKILESFQKQAQKTDTKKKLIKQKYKVKIPVIESPNVEVPSASDAVSVVYNSEYGRHIVAARDIKPGELIAVEKGYSYILDPIRCYSHCANCTECCLALIPCDYCYIAMYCSEKCRTEHWEQFHEIECRVFSILYEISDNGDAMFNSFCIRLVLQALREFGSIQSLRNELLHLKERNEQLDPRTQGFDSNMKYHSDKYTSIYSLTKNVEKRSSFDLFRRGVNSCILLYLLVKHSTFFGEKKEMKLSEIAKDEDITFIGGLILSHQQLIPSNFHDLEEILVHNSKNRGMVSLAFCSLFNHSCMPNVIRYSVNTTMVLHTVYPIKKGEQLFDNYGFHYAVTVRSRRQEALLGQYYFFCQCLPCRENWRTSPELLTVNELLKPPLRKSFIARTLEMLDYLIVFVGVASAKTIEDRKDIRDSLFKMLTTLYEHSLYPSLEFSKITETLRHAYSMLGNVHYFPKIKIEEKKK